MALVSIVGVAYVVFGRGVWADTVSADAAWAMIWLGLSAVIDSCSDVIYGVLQREERMDQIALSTVLRRREASWCWRWEFGSRGDWPPGRWQAHWSLWPF